MQCFAFPELRRNVNLIIYYASFNRIDATHDSGYGRFMNDDNKDPSLKVEIIEVEGIIYPIFFARRDIQMNEEITYNYGSGSYFWREKGTCFIQS